MKRNIVLCGFMGCGKSTVGRLLAELTGYTFSDSDEVIERAEGRTIKQIFAENGEEYFRRLESDTVKRLSEGSGLVISTGGGVVLNAENVRLLRETGFVVYLRVSPETVIKRLRNDRSRPLLMRPDRDKAVKELMGNREPLYKAACHAVTDADRGARETARDIMSLYFDKS